MSDEQLQSIVDSVKSSSKNTDNITKLLYQLIDTAKENNTNSIDVSDIRDIVDEL